MKTHTTFLFLLIIFSGSIGKAEDIPSYAEKTKEHVQIAGTDFWMIPPEGFLAAGTFQGFQDDKTGSSIMVIEIPGPFSKVIQGFEEKSLEEKGMKLLERREFLFMEGLGLLMKVSQKDSQSGAYLKWILAFGDENTTTLLNGIFPERFEAEMSGKILKALLSTVVEKGVPIDPLQAASFQLDVSETKLRFTRLISGTLIYTVAGVLPVTSEDQTVFIAGPALGRVPIPDKRGYALGRIQKYPKIKDVQIKSSDEISIDGLSGYEISAEGIQTDTNTKKLLYQTILYDERPEAQTSYYLLTGATNVNFEENLQAFKKVARSFKRK